MRYFLPSGLVRIVLLAGFTVVPALMTGCAGLMPAPEGESQTVTNTPATPPTEVEKYRPIPAETLYSLLVAEVAGQRQRYDISLYHYINQARRTQDPDVSERATRIAQYIGSSELAEEAINIWLKNAPLDPGAHQAAAQLEMERGNFALALDHLIQLQELANISQFDYLAANASRRNDETKRDVLSMLQGLNKRYPDNANLWQAQSILEQQSGLYEAALEHTDKALELQPAFLSARIQKARLLAQMNRVDDAIAWLTPLQQDNPEHKGIAVLRARLLLQQRKMEDALDAFTLLHQNFPRDPAILLSLALLEDELEKPTLATQHLQKLLNEQSHLNEAHFYLGKIDDRNQRFEQAIEHFSAVNGGREFLAAQLRASELISQHRSLDEARNYLQTLREKFPRQSTPLTRIEVELLTTADQKQQAMVLLTEALTTSPRDLDLLYTRAMLAEQLDDLELLEKDLRFLISIKPDHAEALNALGYTLADRTDRWDEALPLVEKALSLAPENPAVIDSLGWIYFRTGDFERAMPLLKQAFEIMPDHEIAAHYGELLWITGNKEEARAVWQQGLDNTPDSEFIQQTLERLNVTPDE